MNSTTNTSKLSLLALLVVPVVLAAAQTPAQAQALIVPGTTCVLKNQLLYGYVWYACPIVQNPGVQVGGISWLSVIVEGDYSFARVCREHVNTGDQACTYFEYQAGPGRHQNQVLLQPVLNPDGIYPTAIYTVDVLVTPGATVAGLYASNVPTGH